MAGSTSVALLREIQTLFDAGTAAGLSDRQLLERFAGRRDPTAEAAFEALVLRHGPMVLRVCRNVLHDPNDVQDAFQATFLVLVRRSGAVRQLESLGGWLYGVANRVAARARVESARRRAVEGRAALRVVEAFEPTLEAESEEFGPIVQEEVRRLPEKYRAAVVLCYWQGLTHDQAAVQLGIPLGTVRSRMARARELLRRRLTRRGLTSLAGAVGVGFEGASDMIARLTPVPGKLLQATIRSAVGQATGQVVSGMAACLVQRVLWSMTMIKIGGVVAGVVLVGLVGYGVGIAGQQAKESRSGPSASQKAKGPNAPAARIVQEQPKRGKSSAARDPERKGTRLEGVYSNIEGQTVIMKIVPDGSLVKKGDVVCDLDSAALRDRLVNQQITRKSAEANFQNSKLRREDGERALGRYRDDLLPREQRELEGEVKVAESELGLAEEELKHVQAFETEPRILKRAEVPVARARLALEKAKNRLHLLTDYTKGQRIKELQSAVEKARSDELARQATWELEKSKEVKLERQIASCTLVAPIDGTIVYPRYLSMPVGAMPSAGRTGVPIQVGATVRERQLLFQVVPIPGSDPEAR
jgi:HlyD family secretion protein